MKAHRIILTTLAASLFSGCGGNYVNSPATRAHVGERRAAINHQLVARAYNAKPAIRFPATIGVAPRDAEAVKHLRALDALGKLDNVKRLPDVRGVVTVSGLVMADGNESENSPTWNKSDVLLREGAARLHADAVLLMNIETSVTDGQLIAPLTTATLGLFPNTRYEIVATAFGALVDVRTGYVYGIVEKSAAKTGLVMTAFSGDAIGNRRFAAEREAMEKMVAELPSFWAGVVGAHKR